MRANSFSDCLGVYSKYNYTLVTWPIDQNKKNALHAWGSSISLMPPRFYKGSCVSYIYSDCMSWIELFAMTAIIL